MVTATPREIYLGEKTWHPFYRRLGETQGRSGRVQEISLLSGFDPRAIHPVASCYTDWTIPSHKCTKYGYDPRSTP